VLPSAELAYETCLSAGSIAMNRLVGISTVLKTLNGQQAYSVVNCSLVEGYATLCIIKLWLMPYAFNRKYIGPGNSRKRTADRWHD
jgi:hypothetical protein